MAKFLESASSIKKEVKKPKKKKQETTQQKVQSPSVSQRARQAQNQKMTGGYSKPQTVRRSSSGSSQPNRSQQVSQQTQRTVDRLQQKYGGGSSYNRQATRRTQPRNSTISRQGQRTVDRLTAKYGQNRIEKDPREERRRQERLREAQRQKMGLNSMASRETQEAANRAIKNTPSLVKKAVKDTVSGHLQTIADVTEMTASNKNGTQAKAMKMGIQDNPEEMRKLEQRQEQTVEKAKLDREKWAKEQDQRQQAWDKKVNGATGVEKAYYGAVESGTGMLTDLALGLGTQGGSLAAMASRTYGQTRGQAEKEGATEAEDRAYAAWQAIKEVGTELMFPGVGLAKGYAKKTGLPLAERIANNLTKNMANRTAADLTGAGIRLLGGTAEENLEEVAGWGLDPLIKEFTYGRNVRTRQKMADLQAESDELRSSIQSEDDARRVASYLNSSEWLDQNKQQYMEAGLSEKKAEEVAEKMRDYMTASLTGDTKTMESLEKDIASTLSKGEFSYGKNLDKAELLDTLASTTLLTMTTGLPGTATTAMRGSVIRDNLGTDGIRTLAESAMNYEDAEASKRGEVARDRINAGKELTSSQVYELAAAQAQQVEKDTRRVVAKNNVVADTLESEKLVAPMIMRDDKGNIQGDKIITQRYNDSAEEAENVLRDIDKEQKLSLSDSELAVGSRAIAGFQTGAFTINDANALNYTNTAVREAFEKVTGVDLGQYVVKTSSGAVDYAATNAATKDALFTMAADNFIETARAETENFKDVAKGITAEQMAARVGSEGDVAISNALDTVDPADEDTYGLMASAAQNVYEYGRYTEDTWDDVSANLSEMYPGLSQEALQDVYDAAKRDKAIAETPYYNAKVTAGESTRNMDMSEAEQTEYGKFTNDTGEDIGKKERTVLESIAREFNINIRLLPSEFFEYKYVDRNGKEKTAYSNGSYDPKTGTMLLNGGNDTERNIIAVALHEIAHHIAIYAPDEYLALSNRVMETWYKNDADAFSRAIQRKQDNYKAQIGQNLSEEQALEEVIADAMGEMSSDPDFISQICTEEPSLAEQIINAIRSVMRKLRAILASGNVAEEYEDAFFNQLGIWDDAQRLWLQAAKVAQQQRASQMIDEWDENARQRTVEEPETRHSINDADIMPEEETQNRLEENFDDYKEDKDNLRLATEAITDLQNVRYSVAENTSDISGRWSRGEQVRTIGKGITADLVNEGYVEFRGRKVKGPEDLAKLCQVLRDPRFETFRVVLTKGDKIVSLRSISSRLPGLAQAFESENISDGVDIVRDRMKRTGADGYYLIHNHPSGNVTASFADLSVTRAYLALLGQDTYKGHIILDHDKYGFIDADVPQVIRGENFPTAREESITGQQTFDLIHEPEIDHPLLGEEIHGHADIAKCGQFVNASDDVSVLLYTNSPGEVTGIQEISNKTLKNNKEITGFIRNQGVEFGAASAFLYTTDIETYQASKDLVKSGHLVDSVVAYGNNRQWSESAREVVSPRADVEVLGQVHDDVIRRTHVFESATGATEYKYSLPETDNEGKSLTEDQRTFFRNVAPELLDENGNIKRYFHGTARADRVGYYFNPERATSGPMAYFTDNRDIAANYSRDKADTSLAYEGEDINDYHNQFVVDVDGEEVRLEDYWYQLPANKRIEYRERAGHITYDYDGEDDTALIIDENVNNGNGGYGADPYLNRQARGNAFRMLIDAWLDSGDFFNEEERFLEVMDLLGMEGVRYKDPNYRDEKVYEVYLNVTNPLVTTELDEEFAVDVEDWLDNTDLDYYARESASADMWDKNDRDPYDWLESLRDDIENGTTHVWTSIPDVITDFLKEQGYDGIVDQGGKYHEAGHQVVIPFEPNQIKLTTNEHPTDDVDIRYSIAETDSEGNFLSDGQRRYFNNSLAVDEQGRLVPVYHTTNVGVFTIFDPARSDDHRSLFFTNSRRMSESYSKRGGRSTNDINPYSASNVTTQIDDVNNLPDFLDDDIIQRVRDRISNIIVRDAEGNVVAQGNDFVDVARQFAPIMIENDYDPDALDYLADDAEYAMNDAWQLYADAETLSGLTYTMDFAEMTGTYSCYLNFENPLIIDNEQSDNWQSIRIPKELQEGMWNYFGYMFSAASTRQYAEYAQEMGYDGVILRNIVDYADYGYGNEPADVYIAFSSEQVKDIRNTDPTNNPDIRYSITDDEEAQSKMAYDDAMDTSYEALAYYETLMDESEEQIELYADSFSEEKINDFYAGLNSYTEYFVFDDPVLEEGRKRMARSRADFMERLNAEWNERWLTDGEVLDLRSVKKDVRQLVMGVMKNSDTSKQYKTETVNKTLIDIRLAYQFAKKGRIDVADALLWHSAQRMIEDVEFINDETFNNYKDLRDYLRTTRIQLGEEYWSDVDYAAFRKANYGRMKLVKGETNVDQIYQEMCERWPEWFDEEEDMTPPDQLLQIEHVLDVIQPYKEAYSSEEAASIATDIAYDLSDIVYGKGKPYESIADKYKNRYDKQTKALKQRHREALRKVKEQRDKGIKAERAKWQVKEQRRKERQAHKKYFDSIVKSYDWLTERLLTNTKDKHIPEQYKKELAGLLSAFDLQTVGSKKVEERRGQKGQKTIRMEAIKTAINNIEAKTEFFHINDSITDIIDDLTGKDADGTIKKELSIEGKTIDELSVDELKKIDNLLKALRHEFTYYETVRTGVKRQQAADIGTAQVDSALKHAELFGPGKDYNNFLGAVDKIVNMDEMTPAYLFKRIDPNNTGLGMMFKELRRSFDKYVKNQEQLNEWMEEILKPYHRGGKLWKKYGAEEIENWRLAKATNTFKLQNGDEIRLTPAQMMSLYCLSKRQQAYQHMVGAGIVIKPVSFQAKLETDLKRKTNGALPTILTDGDIKMICTSLTPDQKKVADQLQQLMATKMAAWGNEASRAVIGIDLFGDPDYFPINTDKAAHDEDFTADQFADMIRNFGFTKAVKPGAKNTIAIDDIFTVVSTHCNNMNLYNAYSESMNDFMKVYNFHALRDREDGKGYSDYSVKQVIAHAYSQKATTFISTFMRDLNGNVSKGRVTGIDNMMNAALGNAKKASVFANGRVALQQPTAIMRAFAVISPKYLKGVKIEKGAMQEMFEHCPIALWKSWGYYDINMGKSIEDIMMNNGNWLEDKMTDIYGAADNVTWTAIWQMCKAEVRDKHPNVKEGSDEFWDLCNERMTEVVDLTQVVDSPFHRSHAMRDKQIPVKMATSFMAEPTLTFNMVRDGFVNAVEMYKTGDKAGAAKLVGKTSRVFVLSAFATAAMAAVWDAVRGKQPDGDDDDDDGTAIGLWWANTLANFEDNLKLWNNIYYIKDISSLFDGWGVSNLALQGWKQFADGYAQLTGAYTVKSKKSWWENMLAGIGYLSGIPFGTILKDGKALMNLLGVHPAFLSDIGDRLDSVQDMLGGSSAGSGTGKTSSNNSSNNKKSGSDESDKVSSAVRLWTYNDAPFRVQDGSIVDNFLNHFGVNLTSAEIAAAEAAQAKKEHEKTVEKLRNSLSEYSGAEYDNKLWDKSELSGYGKALSEGDFERAEEIEQLFIDAGGSRDFLNEKKLYHYKKNWAKTIIYDPTDEQIEQQTRMKEFMLLHGVTEEELSEKAYKSQTCKELKVAFRLNDEDAMVEELVPLIRAGLSYEDFEKAYKNRNGIDLKKYKESNGKYAERLKSTGVYNWPVNGTITSHFGYRNSPGGIGSTNHKGLDIAAGMGTPVGAADGGTVVYAGWDGGFGKCVRIQHDDGTITEYGHLSWWEAKVGDTVAQGQTIGNVGSTGNSTGPHLHFGVMVNGSYVDPLTKLN